MRPDVKLGVVVSSVVVVVAGTYYLYRDKGEAPIQVSSDVSSPETPDGKVAPSNVSLKAPAGKTASTSADRTGRGPSMARRRIAYNTPAKSGPRSKSPAGAPSTGLRTGGDKSVRTPQRSTVNRNPSTTTRRRSSVARPGLTVNSRPARKATGGSADHTSPRRNRPGGVADRGRRGGLSQRRSTRASSGLTKNPVALTATRPYTSDSASRNVSGRGEAAMETHRVQAGDTLASLAERYYGDEGLARFLLERNPQVADPNRPRVGQLVKIPPRPASGPSVRPRSASAKPVGKAKARTYRVKAGDSFYRIAGDLLGDSSRWKELLDLNKELVGGDPKRLQVGQLVKVPNR